jgi:hypothetical protein
LTGPNSVLCSPSRKMQPSISGTCVVNRPAAASTMITISRFLTMRVSAALSNLSASWPDVAENSRNGAMKTAPIASPASDGGSQSTCSR